MTIGERLKYERQRLGLSQTAMGEIGGVTKMTQINYEKDARVPDAAYLARLAAEPKEKRVDVFYVLTGQRITSKQQPAPLTQEEIEILVNYRLSREEDRQALARMAAATAQQAKPKAQPRVPKTAVVLDTEYKGKRTGPQIISTEYTGKRTGPQVVGQEAKPATKKKRKDGAP